MKSALPIAGRSLVLALVLLAAGCDKRKDDCPAPANNDPQATTRAAEAGENGVVFETGKGSGVGLRGAEQTGDDLDGIGISDDGDDEADGEGNKKNRPAH